MILESNHIENPANTSKTSSDHLGSIESSCRVLVLLVTMSRLQEGRVQTCIVETIVNEKEIPYHISLIQGTSHETCSIVATSVTSDNKS